MVLVKMLSFGQEQSKVEYLYFDHNQKINEPHFEHDHKSDFVPINQHKILKKKIYKENTNCIKIKKIILSVFVSIYNH